MALENIKIKIKAMGHNFMRSYSAPAETPFYSIHTKSVVSRSPRTLHAGKANITGSPHVRALLAASLAGLLCSRVGLPWSLAGLAWLVGILSS